MNQSSVYFHNYIPSWVGSQSSVPVEGDSRGQWLPRAWRKNKK